MIDKRSFILYLCRWQASTPILYGVLLWLGNGILGTLVANLIGGCIFYFVDQKIFNLKQKKVTNDNG